MNVQLWRGMSGVTAAAVFALRVAAADDPPTVAPTTSAAPPTAISVATTNTSIAPTTVVPSAVTNAETVRLIQVPKLSLPLILDQVVKLSQSGADETVVRAYVEKAAPPYRITGNEIVQLRDLGISQGVIMSLIEHSQSADVATTTEMVGQQNPSQVPPPPATAQTNVAEAPLSEDVAPFYDALAPYGGWYDVPGYGWAWQPSVVVVNPGWRPYCDNGYWLWSDYGWYWNSYYSWGWAPFHYGRWFSHGNSWYWCPDRVWGSSWVSWRNSSTHCGWAPLPPGAHCRDGNWTHHGKHAAADSDFGIHSSHFNFVEHGRFTDRHVGRQTVAGGEAQDAFRNSRVANGYSLGADNRLINNGVGRDTIAAASRTPIRNVSVQELPRNASGTMPDRVSRVGRSDVVFRPNAQVSVPRTTAASVQPNRAVRSTSTASVTPSNSGMNQRGSSRLVTSANANTYGRQVFPTSSASSPSRGSVIQSRPNGNMTILPRTASRSVGQNQAAGQNRVYAQSSAPAYNPRATAPVASAPRSSAPASVARMSAPRSGGGGRQISGNASRSGSGGSSVSRGSSGGAVSHGLRR
jgi:hypothetical protein